MRIKEILGRFDATGRLPVLYIAGPMSGREDWNFPAFNDLARKLRLFGFPVLNPADFGPGDATDDPAKKHDAWVGALNRDLPLVAAADVVVFLEGWEGSAGATLEFDVATAYGKPMVPADHTEALLKFIELFCSPDEFLLVMRADKAAEQVRRIAMTDHITEVVCFGPDERRQDAAGPAEPADRA